MRNEMSEVTYATWISAALRPVEITGDHFVIEAATDFYHQFVVPRYSGLIKNSLSQVAGRPLNVSILTPQQAEAYREDTLSPARIAPPVMTLNPKYTFESFVVGNGNRFAHAAALAVAESPADAYNPLFIYGGVGLGKTHLMHAIGHFILQEKPDTRLCYVTSEDFTNELIAAIQQNKNVAFREKYRSVDVLMVDDIQFISGRDSTQEEFFHTFNALHAAGKQIIISSDRQPKEIARLEERLRSRFEWGLIADVQRPDLETRVAILRTKAKDEIIKVSDEVINMIAERVESNIRELEGCLTRIVAYSSLSGQPVDVQLTDDALREVFSRAEPRHITCEDVIDCVARYYSITPDDLTGPRRNREITVPRQIAMYLCREMTDASLPRIGQSIGGRDHSTILYGCDKIAGGIKTSPSLASLVSDIQQQLKDR